LEDGKKSSLKILLNLWDQQFDRSSCTVTCVTDVNITGVKGSSGDQRMKEKNSSLEEPNSPKLQELTLRSHAGTECINPKQM
jgi:hypothetical protein